MSRVGEGLVGMVVNSGPRRVKFKKVVSRKRQEFWATRRHWVGGVVGGKRGRNQSLTAKTSNKA